MLSHLRSIFGSKTKAQEILLLLKDAKEVVRQGFYEAELPAVEQFCQKNNLFLAKSKFKVLLADGEKEYTKPQVELQMIDCGLVLGDCHIVQKNSCGRVYSNLGMRISEEDPRPGMFFIYFSKNEKKALLASYAELMNRPRELGILLGYPECCINYFCQQFREDNPNPQHQPTNFLTNLSLRVQDYALLSHFPCHSECAESKKLAQKYFEVIAQADSGWAGELREKLEQSGGK